MRSILRGLVPLVLLAVVACQREAAPAVVYGPWEEGLTLAFENPSQPQPQRFQDRIQVRVAQSAIAPGTPGLVMLDFSSTRGQIRVHAKHGGGGIDLVDEQGRILARSLPPGFPDTSSWVDRGTEFTVIGRAAWEGAAVLPATADPVGVWVEARPSVGPRRRSLYLPNLGEVEAREARNGSWIVVNRLVARGFTDLPALKRP